MPGIKISQLTSGGAIQSSDQFPVGRGTSTRRIAGSEILTPNNFIVSNTGNSVTLNWNASTKTLEANVGTSVPTSTSDFVAKAWVNFNGATAGTWNGGASTVLRTSGSTTATITTTNPHKLQTGNKIEVVTGIAAGEYTVTVLTATTFRVTTVATTALNNVNITFAVRPIRSSYNVNSVVHTGTGEYIINFITPMADINYVIAGSAQYSNTLVSGRGAFVGPFSDTTNPYSVNSVKIQTTIVDSNDGQKSNLDYINLVVFGN